MIGFYILLVFVLVGLPIAKGFIIQKLEKSTLKLNAERLDKKQEAFELGIERIRFKSNNSTVYAQWYVFNANAPSVFIVHGNGESLSDWVDTQKLLYEMGYNAFVFDFSGFGSSTGKATVTNLKVNTIDAWKAFCKRTNIANQRIVVAHSLGVAVLLDSIQKFESKPNKIILHGAFSSAREISIAFGSIKKQWAWLIPDVWNNMKNIRNTGSVDTILYHSNGDKKIPYAMSENIAKYGKNVNFVLLEFFGHNAVYEYPELKFWTFLLPINQNLRY